MAPQPGTGLADHLLVHLILTKKVEGLSVI